MQKELDWAKDYVDGVETYLDFEDMLANAQIDVLVVSSVTDAHATQAIAAINKGLHVLCEKPLSLDKSIVSIQILRKAKIIADYDIGSICCRGL